MGTPVVCRGGSACLLILVIIDLIQMGNHIGSKMNRILATFRCLRNLGSWISILENTDTVYSPETSLMDSLPLSVSYDCGGSPHWHCQCWMLGIFWLQDNIHWTKAPPERIRVGVEISLRELNNPSNLVHSMTVYQWRTNNPTFKCFKVPIIRGDNPFK